MNFKVAIIIHLVNSFIKLIPAKFGISRLR